MKLYIAIKHKDGTVEETESEAEAFKETENAFKVGDREILKSEVKSVVITGFEPFWAA